MNPAMQSLVDQKLKEGYTKEGAHILSAIKLLEENKIPMTLIEVDDLPISNTGKKTLREVIAGTTNGTVVKHIKDIH